MHRYVSLSGLRFLQNEHERNHEQGNECHDAEVIDKREHHGLSLHGGIYQSFGLRKRLRRAGTVLDESMFHPLKSCLQILAQRSHVSR